jgi:DNA-directed RNA polymerase specialized sigma24 family protein
VATEPPEQPRPRHSVETYTRTIRPWMGTLDTLARRILGDEVEAWDAVQEALIS